jgi:hypothetical protein
METSTKQIWITPVFTVLSINNETQGLNFNFEISA